MTRSVQLRQHVLTRILLAMPAEAVEDPEALLGGDEAVAHSWLYAENLALGGRPIDKITSVLESYPKGIAGFRRFTTLIDTEPEVGDSILFRLEGGDEIVVPLTPLDAEDLE